jgi:hypothetical protein
VRDGTSPEPGPTPVPALSANRDLRCSREQAVLAVRSEGVEVLGSLPAVRRMGRPRGFRLRGVECGDLTRSRKPEMLVELDGSHRDPWAVFVADGGMWRLLFSRPNQPVISVQISGGSVSELLRVYRLDGRMIERPRRSRFALGSDGSVDYRRAREFRPVVTVNRGGLARIGPLPSTASPIRAARIFGFPTRAPHRDQGGCRIYWSDLGLRLLFRAARVKASCREGHLVDARIAGDAAELIGWHTGRGLGIGDSAAELGRRYLMGVGPTPPMGRVPLSFPAASGPLRPTLQARLVGGGVRELRVRPQSRSDRPRGAAVRR